MDPHRTGQAPEERRSPAAFFRIGTVLVIAGALFISSYAPIQASHPHSALQTLRGTRGVGTIMDPAAGGGGGVVATTNASLVQVLPSGRVAPDLAHWTVSKDHLIYTFTIRNNARFSNGHYVTAQDSAFSLIRSLEPSTHSPSASYYLFLIRGAESYNQGRSHRLSGVKVLGKRILQITITKPVGYFLVMLAGLSMVLDRSVVAGRPIGNPNKQFQGNYLTTTCSANQGAGPFKFVCHDRSSTPHSFYSGHLPAYTLEPNPYYYGRKPGYRVRAFAYPDPYKAYITGKVDLTLGLPSQYIGLWKGKSKELLEYPGSTVHYLAPNLRQEPFNNLHCRLAVAYAIDRQVLANNILGGLVRASYAIVPREMLGWYNGKDNPHYNPTRARKELAKCPGRTGPVDLVYSSFGDRTVENEYIAMLGMLQAIGMNVKLKSLSQNDYFTAISQPLQKSGIQLVQDGWSQDYADPQDFCSLLLHSGSQFNVGQWHSVKYDHLVDRADTTLVRKTRAKLYIAAQHLALSQGALISLDNAESFSLLKPYVHGFIETEAANLWPKNGDWANVSISPH